MLFKGNGHSLVGYKKVEAYVKMIRVKKSTRCNKMGKDPVCKRIILYQKHISVETVLWI